MSFYSVHRRYFESPSTISLWNYKLVEWTTKGLKGIEDGDDIIIVEKGKYQEKYKGKWGTKNTDGFLDTCVLTKIDIYKRPKHMKESQDEIEVYQLILQLEYDYPELCLRLYKYFGFEDGDENMLRDELEKMIEKNEANKFPLFQGIYCSL